MKLKLVFLNGEKILYCPNGSILKADDKVLARLLTEFNKTASFKGTDGSWDSLNCDMKNTIGTTLAIVDDNNNLIVYSVKAFASLKGHEEYVSASEYGAIYGKSHSLIRRLCDDGRIPGAIKNSTGWLIPKNAPYPDRKPREIKNK